MRIRRGVSGSGPLLDRAGIEEVFRRLGDRLAKRGVVADIYVFGGAAMALAYDARRAPGMSMQCSSRTASCSRKRTL